MVLDKAELAARCLPTVRSIVEVELSLASLSMANFSSLPQQAPVSFDPIDLHTSESPGWLRMISPVSSPSPSSPVTIWPASAGGAGEGVASGVLAA